MNRAELARFMRHVNKTDTCWLWTGKLTPNGYATWSPGPGKPNKVAHRIAYEHFVGPIPDGLQTDHLAEICGNRNCVNPAHLEPVTPSENTRRQDHAERRVTECPKGHPYDDTNTIRRNGRRFCRTCDIQRKRDARTSNSP